MKWQFVVMVVPLAIFLLILRGEEWERPEDAQAAGIIMGMLSLLFCGVFGSGSLPGVTEWQAFWVSLIDITIIFGLLVYQKKYA